MTTQDNMDPVNKRAESGERESEYSLLNQVNVRVSILC